GRHRVTGRTGGHGFVEQGLPQGDGVVGAVDRTRAGGLAAGFGTRGALGLLRDAELGTGNGAAGNQNGAWRPVLVVDMRDPVHEGDKVGDFLVGQIRVGHEAPVALLVVELRGVFEKGRKIRCAAMLGNLGKVGRVVGALAQYRMTVDTVVGVPDVLPAHDFVGNVL